MSNSEQLKKIQNEVDDLYKGFDDPNLKKEQREAMKDPKRYKENRDDMLLRPVIERIKAENEKLKKELGVTGSKRRKRNKSRKSKKSRKSRKYRKTRSSTKKRNSRKNTRRSRR